MPATEDQIPDFDDFDTKAAPAAAPSVTSALPTAWPAKKKKNKKKNAVAKATKASDEEEDSNRLQSVTPPEDEGQGVELTPPVASSTPPAVVIDDAHTRSPPAPANWDWDDEPTLHGGDTESQPTQSPPVRSPRLQNARLASPPVSPQTRPATLHSGSEQYSVPSTRRLSGVSAPATYPRKESLAMLQPTPPRSRFVDPPPPHMPQSHFFGLPDFGLNIGPKQGPGKPAGFNGCCRLDSFSDAGHVPSARKARDALLVGSEGGLDVYRVLSDKMEVVGRLEGLRGSVIDAKILPYLGRQDDHISRPLIAVIIHGIMVDDRNDSGQDDDNARDLPNYFQTTVEIYSLLDQSHIATLFRSLPISVEPPTMGQLSLPPKPMGDLSIDAAGRFITLASGKSGEIFVFSDATGLSSAKPERNLVYRCIGKFWTSLHSGGDIKRPTNPSDPNSATSVHEKRAGVPLCSLSNRWLAIVPPYTTAGVSSIQGSPIFDERSPADINSHNAPIQPIITCEVAGIDAEGTLSWLGRKAAQGLLNASHKGYELGMQGWKEWTQPAPLEGARPYSPGRDRDLFPPTNGPADDPKRQNKEPALVTIVDLQTLIVGEDSKPSPPPLATFALVDGCNHISFSPDGLRLLTANRKGEVTTVWDLRNVAHGKSKLGPFDSEIERGPHVKPLHRVTRSSPSVILDSAWSRTGDWLAILTTNGTVHLHEVPRRPPYKKQKRRSAGLAAQAALDKAEPTIGVSAESMSPPSSNGFWGTFKSGLQSVSTQVNAIRSPANASSAFPLPTTFAGFRDATAAARTAGGRAVARGISQGYSAAKGSASDIWHAEDNKIRHKQVQQLETSAPTPSLRWIEKQSGSALAMVFSGAVHIHAVQWISRRKGDMLISGLKHEKHAHKTFTLPRVSPAVSSATGNGKPTSCADEGPHGFWSLRQLAHPILPSRPTAAPTLQQTTDEVETNPPYCPFHIDSRVSVFAFVDEQTSQIFSPTYGNREDLGPKGRSGSALETWQSRGHGLKTEQPWLFGDPLPTSIKMNDGALSEVDDDFDHGDADFPVIDKENQIDRRNSYDMSDVNDKDYANDFDYHNRDDGEDGLDDHLMESRLIVHPATASTSAPGGITSEERISVSTTRRSSRRKKNESHRPGQRHILDGHDEDENDLM